mmetsp:Transcript_17820/g.40376  ORF Transcript_17820/g.40376 Transcript_17820/m.40376 type:complete len:279 (-) Transcript_17820:1741-2577(-)
MTALTMDAKLSSMMMMSEAFLATSVPWTPIANPTSAFFSAGASFVPSPVTATVCETPILLAWMPETSRCLSSGVDLPMTLSFGQTLSNSCWSSTSPGATRSRKVFPSMTLPSSSLSMMPHFLAMAAAVFMLSPVTILTIIPASLHRLIARGTSSRTGSSMPTSPIIVRFFSASSTSSISTLTSLTARQIVRRASSANWLMTASTSFLALSLIGSTLPSMLYLFVHSSTTISAAPLQKTRYFPGPIFTLVLMRFLSEEKVNCFLPSMSSGNSLRILLYS